MGDGAGLAIYNFGLFVAPYESPQVEGFRLREPVNFRAAELAEGFLGRSGYAGEDGPESWGVQVLPRFIEGSGFATAPSSLSLWTDVESLMAFTYSGVHADASKHAKNWQVEKRWPALVLWWTNARPDWTEAVRRFERLADEGPGPLAFTFKAAYGCDGGPISIDRARMRDIALRNGERQAALMADVLSMKA